MKRILSLFTGAGGMDLGFLGGFSLPNELIKVLENDMKFIKDDSNNLILPRNPFEIVYANDINKYGSICYKKYFEVPNNLQSHYELVSISDKLKLVEAGKNTFPKNIDLVIGGFPCQDFSLAGKRQGFESTKNHLGENNFENEPENRGNLYLDMKRVIEITQPKIFLAENVKGLFLHKKNLEKIRSDFEHINGGEYLIVTPKLLNAYHYGVPQNRERVFIFGFKKDDLTNEAIQKLSQDLIDKEFNPYPIPISDFSKINSSLVLSDLLEPELATDVSQKYFSKAKFLNNKSQGQVEINLTKPSPTIRAEHHGNIEFRRLSKINGGKNDIELQFGKTERRLTVRECARLQTFPDNYDFVIPEADNSVRFKVSASQAYKLIGNAVPTLLAYHIALNIANKWNNWFV